MHPHSSDNTALINACAAGRVNNVEDLLKAFQSPNVRDSLGDWMPIHYAARSDHVDVVRLLLEVHTEIDSTNSDHWTPLHLSADANSVNTVRLLIEAGANKNAVQNRGRTALHLAVRNLWNGRNSDVVEILLDAGADPNIADQPLEVTPLHKAAKKGRPRFVHLLLQARANVDATTTHGRTPLHMATWGRLANHALAHPEVVQYLMDAGADKEAREFEMGQNTIALCSARMLCISFVERLLAAGADKDAARNDGKTALHLAARIGSPWLVKQLLDAGCNDDVPDSEGKSPLDLANRAEVVDLLQLRQRQKRQNRAGTGDAGL